MNFIKFLFPKKDHFIESNVYRAPISGKYTISSMIYRSAPTGEFEKILNPNRGWYQFWKPKYITVPVYKTEIYAKNNEIKSLNQGDPVFYIQKPPKK